VEIPTKASMMVPRAIFVRLAFCILCIFLLVIFALAESDDSSTMQTGLVDVWILVVLLRPLFRMVLICFVWEVFGLLNPATLMDVKALEAHLLPKLAI